MRRHLFGRRGDTSAAVAPTVALALFALIGAGGIAFDYARLVTLDTELQNAADQAALAAATQLDRTVDSQTQAIAAVNNSTVANRLAANITRFGNDGQGSTINFSTTDTKGTVGTGDDTVATHITFCSAFNDAVVDSTTACTATSDGTLSRYVMVTTTVRTAKYAFTPIVAVFGGSIKASAVAGIESSICNVAPLLVCAPNDEFPTATDIGKGLLMKVAGGNSWAPGNYGFLDFGNGNPAVLGALLGNGLNGCQGTDDNETEPGNKNATDAINTRMDHYAGLNKNDAANCVTATGAACPSQNTRKDMVRTMTYVIEQPAANPAPTAASVPACGTAATGNGNPNPSIGYSTDFAQNKDARQFGRDNCHYTGNCTSGNFGNGTWERDTYISTNHSGFTADSIATAVGGGATGQTLTRHQIYQWEIANMATGRLDPMEVGTMAAPTIKDKGNGANAKKEYTFTKQCAFNKPIYAAAAASTARDRRILPIVAANCTNLKGKGSAFEDYVILRVFDIFLTEPSLQRSAANTGYPGATEATDDKEIYGEVIGPAKTVGGGTGFQYYSRNRPYLVR